MVKDRGFSKIFDKFLKYLVSDSSTWALVVSNLVIIIFALIEKWNLWHVMQVYWLQSVLIGFFNFLRILTVDFTVQNLLVNDKPVKSAPWVKFFLAFFFAIHYGIFHLVYAVFLTVFAVTDKSFDVSNLSYILIPGGIFFVNHLFSFVHNKKEEKKQSVAKVMFTPYVRIIPMHLTIIFGFTIIAVTGTEIVLIFFLLLKTIADVLMHVGEHMFFRMKVLNKKDTSK